MKSLDNADDFQMPLQDAVTRICFGEVWSRPGLSPKLRSMLTIAILVGQSRPDQLQNHIKGAIGNGVSRGEIREILLHAMLLRRPAGRERQLAPGDRRAQRDWGLLSRVMQVSSQPVRRLCRPATPRLPTHSAPGLRALAKAVTVISCRHGNTRYAMTATAVNELSMDPPRC